MPTGGSQLSPHDIRAYIVNLHHSRKKLHEARVDNLLGIGASGSELSTDIGYLLASLGNEQLEYQGTPYSMIRDAINETHPGSRDTFYDLGSGYGRVLLWGALVCSARFRGIEIVPGRAAAAQAAAVRLGLTNLDIRQGNVLRTPFDDGNIFFMFDPFFPETMGKVSRSLRRIARTRPIRIASTWGSSSYFLKQSWLRPLPFKRSERSAASFPLRCFESI